MEWDDCYGALMTVRPPMPTFILLVPALPVFYFLSGNPAKKNSLIKFNNFLCYILFTPVALLVVTVFTLTNSILAPVSYFLNVARLFLKILNQKQRYQSVLTFLIYLLFGPVLLTVSIPVNSLQLLVNLYASDSAYKTEDYKEKFMIKSEVLEIYIQSLN